MKVILVGGCPRSGTTYLGNFLGSHESLIVTPESQFKEDLVFFGRDLSKWRHTWRLESWGIQYEDLLLCYSSGKIEESELLERLVRRYALSLGRDMPRDFSWVDHTPSNVYHCNRFMVFLDVDLFVHSIRDPRAVHASVKKLPWGPNIPKETAALWVRTIAHAELLKRKCRVIEVIYEDMAEGKAKLGDALSLQSMNNNDQSLSFGIPGYSKKQHELVGKNFDISRVNAWKKSLSVYEVKVISEYCYEAMQHYGYAPSSGSLSTWEKVRNESLDDAQSLALKPINFLKKFLRDRRW